MECTKCKHDMRAGTLTETNGATIPVWYCECGIWYQVNRHQTGDWTVWQNQTKDSKTSDSHDEQ